MARNIEIRSAEEKDIPGILEMLRRLKKLNEEFDTRFTVSDDMEGRAAGLLKKVIHDRDGYLVLVAFSSKKIAGLIMIDVIDRIFYSPPGEGRITEFYIMPEFRRSGLGKVMLERAYSAMKERKIGLLTAEFPSLNVIARNFYTKDGFRELMSIFGKRMGEVAE